MTTERKYTLTQLVANEAYDFARYTVEQRAIPNVIDGFKPVHRFFLTSCIKNARSEFKKVAGIAGNVADLGYKHGENSAAEAGSLMAAEWNNNICLVEGRGNFGSRKIPEPGASRYIYARLHANFNKYMTDIELSPENPDPETHIPLFYTPVIPLVLVNGIRGIATGFATTILPHDPKDITKLVKTYIKTGKINREPKVKFPQYQGTTEYDQDGRVVATGRFERVDASTILVTEITPDTDHISYIKILDKLSENENVRGYDDKSNDSGFKFLIKFKRGFVTDKSDEELEKLLKLKKAYSQNITVIGTDGVVKVYDKASDVIKDFVDWKLSNTLVERIKSNAAKADHEKAFLLAWKWLVEEIKTDRINITKVDADDLKWVPEEHRPHIPALLQRPVRSIMKRGQDELEEKIAEVDVRRTHWKTTTPEKEFISDLDKI